jgi:small subunit ribosomal protein S8
MKQTNYPVGDFLIRIKNALLSGKREVSVGSTKLIKEVAKTLKREGFLSEVSEKKGKLTVKLMIRAKEPVLMDLKLISKPGLRIYMRVDELEAIKGPEVYILSTAQGVMSSKEAIKKRVGGEVIAKVF